MGLLIKQAEASLKCLKVLCAKYANDLFSCF